MTTNFPRVANPPSKAVVVFDGECGFCRRSAERWKKLTGSAVEYVPFQDGAVARRFPELSSDALARSVHLVETDGAVYTGAEAVFRVQACLPGKRWMLWCYRSVPGFAATSEWVYRRVARRRRCTSAGQESGER